MNDELRKLLEEGYKLAAEKCYSCSHKCWLYVFVTYVHEKGYDFFLYQLEHDTLPKEVEISYSQLINLIGVDNLSTFNIIEYFC
ncbi:MAG: hypothetical protein HFJ34_04870 [Clostridia bacterium]|nr:hypothetical protein [Clostridia bacterium]